MKMIKIILLTFPFLFTLIIQADDSSRSHLSASAEEVQETYSDIRKSWGIIPEFLKNFPQQGVVGAWQAMKNLDMNPQTALSSKDKQLIALGVSGQIPCRYCIYFHSEFSRFAGATENEIQEALAVAAVNNLWGSVLSGSQANEKTFKAEVDHMFQMLQGRDLRQPSAGENTKIHTAEEAYKDIKETMGLVPSFVYFYPKASIAGVWKEFKNLYMNPQTQIPNKTKALISIAIGSQGPSPLTLYFDTKAAKMHGASDQEIAEAVALAALVRHWSTYINGLQLNEDKFRKEVQQIMKHLKTQR